MKITTWRHKRIYIAHLELDEPTEEGADGAYGQGRTKHEAIANACSLLGITPPENPQRSLF